MKTIRSISLSAAVLAALLAGCVAGGHHNPIDPVSNQSRLSYADVHARRPDFKEPFLRDGVVSQSERFRTIQAGLPQAQVLVALGQPLKVHDGAQGAEWDYNFKFLLPQSENYLVCQYKVVFDSSQAVRDAVWRRRQCLDLVSR
ncbi:MAG: outer membrane protein assembly factor BamE [Proteobacteria bacterium]|nr:outer membrane protein assembly factor BamE [Pseudomonadota bacterium]